MQGLQGLALPKKYAPFVRDLSDVTERQLKITPYPNVSITSTNCASVVRFELPPSGLLDLSEEGLYLDFNMQLLQPDGSATLGSRIGPYFGHLLKEVRVYINNELVEECICQGQLNNLIQSMCTPWQESIAFGDAIQGSQPQPLNPLYGSTPIGYAIQLPDDPVNTPSLGALAPAEDNRGYNIPSYTGMTQTQTTAVLGTAPGPAFRIPLTLKGSIIGPGAGIIPNFRTTKFRIELTFNPSSLVLYARSPVADNGAAVALDDYKITNLSITAMYAQSPSLAGAYSGNDWVHSHVQWSYYQAPLKVQLSPPAELSIPINVPWKSTRYILGVIANPSQFSGGLAVPFTPTDEKYWTNAQTGNVTLSSGSVVGTNDDTRWNYFYGLGGYFGGAQHGPFNTEYTEAALDPPVRSRWFGQDASYIPTTINFYQNGEWIYPVDLQSRADFMTEIEKVFPSVRTSAFFSVTNFPGIRGVIVINLQTPTIAQEFVCGNRSDNKMPIGRLKLALGPNFGPNSMNPTVTTSNAAVSLLAGSQFVSWVCHDSTTTINFESGSVTTVS